MSQVKAHGETMKRLQKGLYAGPEVRAEQEVTGFWRFQMLARSVSPANSYWLEYSPDGHWCDIGKWKALHRGLWIAAKLRAGTHFYDQTDEICRLFTPEVYERLKSE